MVDSEPDRPQSGRDRAPAAPAERRLEPSSTASVAVRLRVVTAAVIGFSACAGPDTDSPVVGSTNESRVVTIDAGMLEGLQLLPVDKPMLLVVAGDDRTPQSYVAQVADAALDSNGGVTVADLKTDRIIRFDNTGKYLGELARGGDGPGEFRLISRIHISGDTLYVHDPSKQIIGKIPLGGGQARETHSSRGLSTDRAAISKPRKDRVLWLNDIVPTMHGYSDNYYDEVLIDDTTETEIAIVEGDEVDVLSKFKGGRAALVSVLPMERYDSLLAAGEEFYARAVVPLPFSTAARGDLLEDGVAIGLPHLGEVRILDARGGLVRTIRFDVGWTHSVVSEDDVYAWVALDFPRKFRQLVRRAGERFGLPETLPFFSSIRTGEDGALWLATGAGPAGRWIPGHVAWLRVSLSGEPLAYAAVPSSITIIEFHEDRLLGLVRDSLDVESVVVLPFRRLRSGDL